MANQLSVLQYSLINIQICKLLKKRDTRFPCHINTFPKKDWKRPSVKFLQIQGCYLEIRKHYFLIINDNLIILVMQIQPKIYPIDSMIKLKRQWKPLYIGLSTWLSSRVHLIYEVRELTCPSLNIFNWIAGLLSWLFVCWPFTPFSNLLKEFIGFSNTSYRCQASKSSLNKAYTISRR